jgi:hypothetical protein
MLPRLVSRFPATAAEGGCMTPRNLMLSTKSRCSQSCRWMISGAYIYLSRMATAITEQRFHQAPDHGTDRDFQDKREFMHEPITRLMWPKIRH